MSGRDTPNLLKLLRCRILRPSRIDCLDGFNPIIQMTSKHVGIRFHIAIRVGELKAIEEFRFRHRLPSRSAAVRELLRLGLAASENRRAKRFENELIFDGRLIGGDSHQSPLRDTAFGTYCFRSSEQTVAKSFTADRCCSVGGVR